MTRCDCDDCRECDRVYSLVGPIALRIVLLALGTAIATYAIENMRADVPTHVDGGR